jgi:hypothetical protein
MRGLPPGLIIVNASPHSPGVRLPLEIAPLAPMTAPLVVSIPHRLGKAEAVRRLKSGLGRTRTDFGRIILVDEEPGTATSWRFGCARWGRWRAVPSKSSRRRSSPSACSRLTLHCAKMRNRRGNRHFVAPGRSAEKRPVASER